MPRSHEPADVARRLRAHDAFICRTGKRSQTASERAAAHGRDAGDVTGGM
jgi:rhodanese-related sulfurtransferase